MSHTYRFTGKNKYISAQFSNEDKKECVRKITFRDGVEVGFLAHGRQQWQGAGVHPYLGVTVIFPGVILDHVEQTADQVEHAMLWVILQTDREHICDYPCVGLCKKRKRR